MREKTERLEVESLGYRRTAEEAETSAEEIKSERRRMQREVGRKEGAEERESNSCIVLKSI